MCFQFSERAERNGKKVQEFLAGCTSMTFSDIGRNRYCSPLYLTAQHIAFLCRESFSQVVHIYNEIDAMLPDNKITIAFHNTLHDNELQD